MHGINTTIAVCGSGLIADAVAAALKDFAAVERVTEPVPADPGPWDGLVVACDSWDLGAQSAAYRACQARRVPWLPVHAEQSLAVIGPLTRPERPGCPECLRLRRKHNGAANEAEPQTPGVLDRLAADLIGTLVAAEFSAEFTGSDGGPCGALLVRLDDLSIERHGFLPEPMCPACGGLPDDTPQDARITVLSRPKQAATRYRLWSPTEHSEEILRTCVGSRAGLIHGIVRSDECGLAVAEASVTLRVPGARVPGGGRSLDYRTSDAVAVLEALERYGGSNPAGKRTVVRAAMMMRLRVIADDGPFSASLAAALRRCDINTELLCHVAANDDGVCWSLADPRGEQPIAPALAAFRRAASLGAPADPPGARVSPQTLAAIAASQIARAIPGQAGSRPQPSAGAVTFLDRRTLRTGTHNVTVHPFDLPAKQRAQGATPLTRPEPASGPDMPGPELARRWQRLADERFGAFAGLDDTKLRQLPLKVTLARMSDPCGLLAAPPAVAGVGIDRESSREQAMLRGLAAYASIVVDPRLLVDKNGTFLAPRDSDAGRLLGSVRDGSVDAFVRAIDLTSLHDITGPAKVPVVACRSATGATVYGGGARLCEAVSEALTAVLFRYQRQRDPVLKAAIRSASAIWTSPASTAALSAPQLSPDRLSPDRLIEALASMGYRPSVFPLDHDQTVHEEFPRILRVVLLRAVPAGVAWQTAASRGA